MAFTPQSQVGFVPKNAVAKASIKGLKWIVLYVQNLFGYTHVEKKLLKLALKNATENGAV